MERRKRFSSTLAVFLAIAFVVFLLYGCESSEKSSSATKAENAEEYDTYNVRDDIKSYIINEVFPSPSQTEERHALLELAESVESTRFAETESEALDAFLKFRDSLAFCKSLGEIPGVDAPSRVIVRKTFDTPEKLREMTAFESLLRFEVVTASYYDVMETKNAMAFLFSSSQVSSDAYAYAEYLIPYVNGINTGYLDALSDAMDLADVIGNHNGKSVKIILVPNPSRNAFYDLGDLFQQKLNEYPQVRSDLILKALLTLIPSQELPQALWQSIMEYHASKIGDHGHISLDDSELKNMLAKIQAYMSAKQKILLIAHSQGSIYINDIFTKLTSGSNALPRSAVKTFAIGSAAADDANGSHITSTNDFMINIFREFGFAVAPANITIRIHVDDPLGHGFNETYLNPDLEGYALILKSIHDLLDSLYFPSGGGIGIGGWAEV